MHGLVWPCTGLRDGSVSGARDAAGGSGPPTRRGGASEGTTLRYKCQGFRAKDGGADRNRTCDLLIANETLYQLSYDPIQLLCKLLQYNTSETEFELLRRVLRTCGGIY